MRIHPSARKHGVSDDDTIHALRHALASDRIDDPGPGTRLLVLGPDLAGNLLELVVAGFDGDDPIVIHAMPMRSRYLDLLRRNAH